MTRVAKLPVLPLLFILLSTFSRDGVAQAIQSSQPGQSGAAPCEANSGAARPER